jgi:hypothetical protein
MGSRFEIPVYGIGINERVDANVLAAEWYGQAWSPAEMADAYGHRWFKTSGITVTPENCDAG